AALLTEPTIEAAAAKAQVGYSTLKAWLREPAFAAAYAAARQDTLERTVAGLLHISGSAVAALQRALTSGVTRDEIRGAVVVLDHEVRGVETLDLARQLDEVKRQMEVLKRHGHGSAQEGVDQTPAAAGPADGDAVAGAAAASPGSRPHSVPGPDATR